MKYRITVSSFFETHSLEVKPDEVVYRQTAFSGGVRRIKFYQIELILISPGNLLSLQVGNEVLSIPFKPQDAKHQSALAELLRLVNQTAGV